MSRTQYQYSLEDPNADELNLWTAKLVDKLKTLPALRDVATDQQNDGWEAASGHRSRHGLAPRHHAAD